MTTLVDRPHTALLIIDVQNGVVAGAPRRDEVIANINTLLAKARTERVPVVWIQHSDDEDLATDAHTTEDLTEHGAPAPEQVIAHTNLYWSWEEAPGRTAGTAETAEVDFAA